MKTIVTIDVLKALNDIAHEVITHPDRNPTMERQAFIRGLEALFTNMKPVHPFYASMLNRLIQPEPENAYPHFDQAFTKPSDNQSERDKRAYMERMRVLVPVALVSALQAMGLTVAKAVFQVSHALTAVGYRWPEAKVSPQRTLTSWHADASRKNT